MENQEKRRGRPSKGKTDAPEKRSETEDLTEGLQGKRVSFMNGRLSRMFTILDIRVHGNDIGVYSETEDEPLILTREMAWQLIRFGHLEREGVAGLREEWRLWEVKPSGEGEVHTTDVTLEPQDETLEKELQVSREFLEEKGLLTAREEEEPKEEQRKPDYIVI